MLVMSRGGLGQHIPDSPGYGLHLRPSKYAGGLFQMLHHQIPSAWSWNDPALKGRGRKRRRSSPTFWPLLLGIKRGAGRQSGQPVALPSQQTHRHQNTPNTQSTGGQAGRQAGKQLDRQKLHGADSSHAAKKETLAFGNSDP